MQWDCIVDGLGALVFLIFTGELAPKNRRTRTKKPENSHQKPENSHRHFCNSLKTVRARVNYSNYLYNREPGKTRTRKPGSLRSPTPLKNALRACDRRFPYPGVFCTLAPASRARYARPPLAADPRPRCFHGCDPRLRTPPAIDALPYPPHDDEGTPLSGYRLQEHTEPLGARLRVSRALKVIQAPRKASEA